ncbi:MAG: hypothetical protein O2955_19980 [Planctomycetota bacterium]|nr:hypothetical protein [Planctomycetota bacterium]MDA1214793.1 hypothetical protein [Planctomycetota bacterium]
MRSSSTTNSLATASASAPPRHTWPLLLWMAQIAIPVKLIDDFHESVPAVSHVATVAIVVLSVTALWQVSRRLIDRYRKQLLLAWCSTLLTFALLEGVLSTLYANDFIELFTSKTSMMVYEQSEKSLLFDPIRGYRLTETPARFMRFTVSQPEYVGTLRGNAQGFPDRDDFTTKKTDPHRRRFAVLGDSFTAAQFIERNWPDRVEELLQGQGVDVELFNFSVDGGGLMNWWSVITRYLELEDYEFDGLIFAVYPGDLSRRFIVGDHSTGQPQMGRVKSWNSEKLPSTLKDAKRYMDSHGVIVNSYQFDSILDGTSQQSRVWIPYLTTNYNLWVDDLRTAQRVRVVEQRLEDHPVRKAYYDAMRSYAEARRLPVMVVHVPEKMTAAEQQHHDELPRDTVRFAEALSATVVDGTTPFRDLDPSTLDACWFGFDPHWTQTGSDTFAEYMVEVLADWPERK